MEDLVPALATALKDLRRAPGHDAGWVDGALRAFERTRPDDYECARRRLGFARRLSDLADLSDEEKATVTLGLFFDVLIGEGAAGEARKTPRNWSEYLLARHDWTRPVLELVRLLRLSVPPETIADAIAQTAVTFDIETYDSQHKPLHVLQSLLEKATSPSAERAARLLTTEQGQELCDLHVRQAGQRYKLQPEAIRESIELLERGALRTLAQPVGASLSTARAELAPSHGILHRRQNQGTAAMTWENFEQRKKWLRSAAGQVDAGHPTDGLATEPEEESQMDEKPEILKPRKNRAPVARPVPEADPDEDLRLFSMVTSRPAAEAEVPPPVPAPKEKPMQIDAKPDGRRTQETWQISRKLEELHGQLQQIGRAAAEGQELLASLVPQLEEISTSMAELDAIVSRWKGERGSRPSLP